MLHHNIYTLKVHVNIFLHRHKLLHFSEPGEGESILIFHYSLYLYDWYQDLNILSLNSFEKRLEICRITISIHFLCCQVIIGNWTIPLKYHPKYIIQ